MVYVSQYFDNLLIAQIYVLPDMEISKNGRKFCNLLFENPRFAYMKTETVKVSPGTKIYSPHQTPEKVFYICDGVISETKDNIELIHNKGDFFGDLPPLLHKNYKSTTVAQTPCEIMLIDVEVFLQVIQQNPIASSEAVTKLNLYTGENKIL